MNDQFTEKDMANQPKGCTLVEEQAMLIALSEAMRCFARAEVPIGAALIHEGTIVAQAGNRVEELGQANAHAEMLCLEGAAKKLGSWRLSDCTLVTTLEPCAMCWGALHLYRIKKLIVGARDLKHGFWSAIHSESARYPNHKVELIMDVMDRPSRFLMQAFFRLRRAGYLERKDGSSSKSK